MTHLGKALRLYRGAHGVEQQALAEAIGITPSQLRTVEIGEPSDAIAADALLRLVTWILSDKPLPEYRQAPVPLIGGKAVSA